MTSGSRVRLAALALTLGALACSAPPTSPEAAQSPLLSVSASTDPFPGASLDARSSCALGRRGDMRAELYWNVPGPEAVQSFLLWLEADGFERQLTRKVLGKPRLSGVAAGFEYDKYGPWKRARLELYAGAPDYDAPKTVLTLTCTR